ncbi:hypothetical protein [Polymorphum gilvum]|uniref:Probable transmembrane protein n=1 Tax=Polymorphum gilvum (strain LMG 25793 / CGMCC 1.9160 / SL003B-26A1) TaxID=991905 RepID=F2IZZ3_POLGS|nr:hypothetical protein [Polymorphum gilvum]ADZ71828.1 Probable transmembrane protein [Polymorphum gilvum SL003B-26A1]
MKSKLHAAAGGLALTTIALFWISTVVAELFGTPADIALVKTRILTGMAVLIPAMIAAGASGFSLGARWRGPLVERKKRRMKAVAVNGLLVLLPSAVFLASKAQAEAFDAWFFAVQGLELAAGAVNVALLGLNMRDGLAMSAGRRRSGA